MSDTGVDAWEMIRKKATLFACPFQKNPVTKYSHASMRTDSEKCVPGCVTSEEMLQKLRQGGND